MNKSKLIITAVALCIALFALRTCLSGPEGQIRKQLNKVEELVSYEAGEGNISTLTKVKRLGGLFTEDVTIEIKLPGITNQSLQGRERIQQVAMLARKQASSLDASLRNIDVELADNKQSAIVEATGLAKVGGRQESVLQDFRFNFEKTEEGWLISKVVNIEALH